MRPLEIGVLLPLTQVDLMRGPGTVEAFDAMAAVVELVWAG